MYSTVHTTDGHSRTVVGIERRQGQGGGGNNRGGRGRGRNNNSNYNNNSNNSGVINTLYIFDPSHEGQELARALADGAPPGRWQPLLKVLPCNNT
jgi:hypothetical protein